jgi:hypothetical protein
MSDKDKITGEVLINDIFEELKRAEKIHPSWPTDNIHAVGIIVEEVGEAMREAIDYELAGSTHPEAYKNLRKELIQSTAMCFRALIAMDNGGYNE